jgi:endonuclease III
VSATESMKKLSSTLKRLRSRFTDGLPSVESPPPTWDDTVIDHLIHSMLLWDATSGQARQAMKRLRESYVDLNELRVSLASETASVLGERYPRRDERAMRLRAILFDIFRREHAVTLSALSDGSKRDVRGYLESLEGIPAFVVSRVMLVCFGAHAIPTDDRMVTLLIDAGVLGRDSTAEASSSWLERQVKAEDSLETYRLLQAWADEDGAPVTAGVHHQGHASSLVAARDAGETPAQISSGDGGGVEDARRGKASGRGDAKSGGKSGGVSESKSSSRRRAGGSAGRAAGKKNQKSEEA